MRIAVLSETDGNETRVAATPETVKKYKALGADVAVQAGAGRAAGIPDGEFEQAGATVAGSAADAAKDADLVLKVRRPGNGELKALKLVRGATHLFHPSLHHRAGVRLGRAASRLVQALTGTDASTGS